MHMRHIPTVVLTLQLEIGFAGELGIAGLTEAIIEAMENGGLIDEAGIVYIKASSSHERLSAIELWAPEVEDEAEAPTIPEVEGDQQPEPN